VGVRVPRHVVADAAPQVMAEVLEEQRIESEESADG